MLRITTRLDGNELVMKLEGCFEGLSVREVDACWRTAVHSSNGRRLRVDLSDVCHVDDAGVGLMTEMLRSGACFVTRGCVMPEIVKEISEVVRTRSCSASCVLSR